MLNKFAEIILSTMLTIMPTETNQSYVPMDVCDSTCQTTPICHTEAECELPILDNKIFTNKKHELIGTDNYEEVAYQSSFLRRETQNELLIRYAIIAQAVSEVSQERSRDMCINYCAEGDKDCEIQCRVNSIWHWDRLSLVSALLTFAREETGYKGDAHMGIISGAGDCTLMWDMEKGAAYYKCKSWCSGQVQIANPAFSSLGYTSSDITGISLDSTKRCFTAITLAATKSRGYCADKDKKSWVAGMFSLYGSGYSCDLEIMNKRERHFWWAYGLLSKDSHKGMIEDFYNNEEVLSRVEEIITASL